MKISPAKIDEAASHNLSGLIEAAWREGWSAGYGAGREDGRWDGTYWCDIDADWKKSETARAAAIAFGLEVEES